MLWATPRSGPTAASPAMAASSGGAAGIVEGLDLTAANMLALRNMDTSVPLTVRNDL